MNKYLKNEGRIQLRSENSRIYRYCNKKKTYISHYPIYTYEDCNGLRIILIVKRSTTISDLREALNANGASGYDEAALEKSFDNAQAILCKLPEGDEMEASSTVAYLCGDIPCTGYEYCDYKSYRSDKIKEMFEDADDIYVRFGRLPKSGKSHNFQDNTTEIGVSVFSARLTKDGKHIGIKIVSGFEFGTLMSFIHDEKTPMYQVFGDMIGYGSDGEPCLANCTSKKLTGKKIYIIK